jgi:acyl carrier protein
MATNLEVVTTVIAEITGIDPADIVPEANLVDNLYIDSVAKIELVVACQQHFGIYIPDEAITELVTVQSVLDYLEVAQVHQ